MGTLNNILITGGSGFVGYWLNRTKPDGVLVVCQNREQYQMRWEMGGWDAIIHCAPISPARVLRYAAKNGARVLLASSGAAKDQTTDYAYNKRNYELMCAHSEADTVIARLFSFVGTRLPPKFAISEFIEAALHGRPLEVFGDGQSVRSYLYGEDMGRWMWKILAEGHGIYEVGSALPYSIAEAALVVKSVIPCEIHLRRDDYPITYYVPDTTRARQLGCEETVGLKEAIERVVRENHG